MSWDSKEWKKRMLDYLEGKVHVEDFKPPKPFDETYYKGENDQTKFPENKKREALKIMSGLFKFDGYQPENCKTRPKC